MIADIVIARAFLVLVALGWLPSRICAQARCLADPDSAATLIAHVAQTLSDADSATLARAGLPYRPRSITLVKDEPLCGSALDAYNALGPAKPLEQAYLIQVDSAAFVMVPMEPEYRSHNIMIYMTSAFQVIFSVQELD